MPVTRFYGPWDARQQGAATVVYSAAGLRNHVRLCAVNGTVCNVVLGANIETTGLFHVPSTVPSFSLDGLGRYRIKVGGTVATLFKIETAGSACLAGLDIVLADAADVTLAFEVGASPVLFSNINVDASAGTLTDVFGAGSTTVTRCIVDACVFTNVTNLFADDGSGTTWKFCRFSDVYVDAIAGSVTIGRGSSGPTFLYCTFENLDGLAVIDINASDCLFRGGLGSVFSVTTHNATAQGNLFLSAGTPSSVALSGVDVWLGAGFGSSNTGSSIMGQLAIGRQVAAVRLDVDGALATRPASATINSAGATLTPGDRSFIRVTHGASASGSVTIAAGVDGQRLVLYFVSVAGTAVYTDGSGNLQLSANFTPTASDTLELVYDATTSKWVELGRSAN